MARCGLQRLKLLWGGAESRRSAVRREELQRQRQGPTSRTVALWGVLGAKMGCMGAKMGGFRVLHGVSYYPPVYFPPPPP